MEIKRFIGKNGNNIELVNEYWGTRNSWGHKTTILVNGSEYSTRKVRYYNRTWEDYRFQTCMKGAIQELIEKNITSHLNYFKENNGILRFKKGQKENIITNYKENNEFIQDLVECLESL